MNYDLIHFLTSSYANTSELATDEVKEVSSKSETIEESNENNKPHGEKIHDRRNGHRKIHIITVKKLKNVKDRGNLILQYQGYSILENRR